MASTATYQEFLPATLNGPNGPKPTELLCEATAGGDPLPPALHCRGVSGAVGHQHHGAGTSQPLEGNDVQRKMDSQQPKETLIQSQGGPGADVQFLLHVDADVDNDKHKETTPVYIALQSIDKKGGASALFLAKNGIDKAASHLIGLAQSANGAVDTKETPVFTASQGGHTAVQHLLQADGDVNQGDEHTTPLERAVQEQHEQHTDVFRVLAQADGNPQDVNRAVPLFSFQKGFNDTVKEMFDKNSGPNMSISGIKVDDWPEASVDVKKATCLEHVEVATAESGETTQLKAENSLNSSGLGPCEADEKDVKSAESNCQVPFQASSCEDAESPFAPGGQSVSSANDEATSSATPLGCSDEETWPADFVTHSDSQDAFASVTDIYCQALPH